MTTDTKFFTNDTGLTLLDRFHHTRNCRLMKFREQQVFLSLQNEFLVFCQIETILRRY